MYRNLTTLLNYVRSTCDIGSVQKVQSRYSLSRRRVEEQNKEFLIFHDKYINCMDMTRVYLSYDDKGYKLRIV